MMSPAPSPAGRSQRDINRLAWFLIALFTPLFFVGGLEETPLPPLWRIPVDLLLAYLCAVYFVAHVAGPAALKIMDALSGSGPTPNAPAGASPGAARVSSSACLPAPDAAAAARTTES